MKDGNIQLTLQALFDFKAFGGGDILQIDAAKAGRDGLDCADDLLRIFGIQADGTGVYVCKFLEQNGLSFHHGNRSFGANIAKAKDCRAVRDDSHHMAFGCVGIGVVWIFMDFTARLGDTRCIGYAEIIFSFQGHAAGNRDLTFIFFVTQQRLFIIIHNPSSCLSVCFF